MRFLSYYGPVFFLRGIYLLWTYAQFSNTGSQFSIPKIWTHSPSG